VWVVVYAINHHYSCQCFCDTALQELNAHLFGCFGGGGYTYAGNLRQQGSALYSVQQGGSLLVDAQQGSADEDSTGIGGVRIGYKGLEWHMGKGGSLWSIVPAAELEGYYLEATETG